MQVLGGRRARLPDRDADARAGGDLGAADVERRGQGLEQPAGDVGAVVVVVDVLEQDRELVAAETGDGVAVAAGTPRSRPVISRSRSSPAAWPRLSLTVLKSSRSMKSTP